MSNLLVPVKLADETVVQVLDLGVNFRGLADSVLMPREAFDAFLADLDLCDDYTLDIEAEAGIEVYDRNSGTTTAYTPRTIAGITGYVVEGFGFTYLEEVGA